jgi:hypothetical protein
VNPISPSSSGNDEPARESCVLDPVACRHRIETRRLVLRAAEQVAPARALVLGAGQCAEIPLAEIAARFARVTLNDIAREPLETALAGVDAASRTKITLHVEDLTGVVERLFGRIRERIASARDAAAASAAMSRLLDARRRRRPAIAGPFDLVIASCVLSQLQFSLTRRCDELFERRFPGQLRTLRDSPPWKAGLRKLTPRMKAAFLGDLEWLTAPGGLIVLSDTVQVCFVAQTAEGRWKTLGTFRTLRATSRLKDVLDERFHILDEAHWKWVRSAPSGPGKPGRFYDVEGLVIRPGAG